MNAVDGSISDHVLYRVESWKCSPHWPSAWHGRWWLCHFWTSVQQPRRWWGRRLHSILRTRLAYYHCQRRTECSDKDVDSCTAPCHSLRVVPCCSKRCEFLLSGQTGLPCSWSGLFSFLGDRLHLREVRFKPILGFCFLHAEGWHCCAVSSESEKAPSLFQRFSCWVVDTSMFDGIRKHWQDIRIECPDGVDAQAIQQCRRPNLPWLQVNVGAHHRLIDRYHSQECGACVSGAHCWGRLFWW